MNQILTLILVFLIHHSSQAEEFRLAILGDSITYGGRWTTSVESALRTTPTFANAEIVNFGLASETVSGLSEPGHAGGRFPRPGLHERLGGILDSFNPTHVLACYGINDGIYMPLDETRQKAFQNGMTRLKTELEKRGEQLVVITAPLYDGDHPATAPQGYDAVLDAQAKWLLSQKGWQVIDIRPDLRNAVAAAKKIDPQFVYARDKIHPGQQGHDFIAASVIRQLWPLWELPGKPVVADEKALELLGKRRWVLQHAWLKKTGHTRPGVPDGLPMEEAEAQAAKLLEDYRAANLVAGSVVVSPTTTSDWKGYTKAIEPPPLKGWKLVWKDEFDGPTIDTTNWSLCKRGTSDWNNTMSKDPRCMGLENGLLQLRGFENEDRKSDPSPFLTGGVHSKGKFSFSHGKVVIRARFKSAKGAWPALWMLGSEGGWPQCGEIDIMEHLNHDDIVYQTVHSQWTKNLDPAKTIPHSSTAKIDRDGFNTYGVERGPDKLVFTVNGEPTFTYSRVPEKGSEQWPFDRPFYFILSMQIGGDWVGTPDPKDFPAGMEIDWVRVYERLPAQEGATQETSATEPKSVAPETSPVIAGEIGYAVAGRHELFDDPAHGKNVGKNRTDPRA